MKQLCLEKIIRLRIRSLIRNKNNKLVSFETYLKRKEIIIRLQIRSLIRNENNKLVSFESCLKRKLIFFFFFFFQEETGYIHEELCRNGLTRVI